MTVIENVPIIIYHDNAAVIVCPHCHRQLGGLVAVNVQIGVADKHSAVLKAFKRTVAYGIAKLVHDLGGVDQTIFFPHLSDR